MTTTTQHLRWRPYYDGPILTPSMARGPEHVCAPDMTALSTYLDAFVATRSTPVHVNVAFNAAYFGYDLAQRGYVGGPLDLDAFPTLTHGERCTPLPVGALVAVAAGGSSLFGELVYREGAHPCVDVDGHVPGWLSGAPAGATIPTLGGPAGQAGSTPTGPVSRREMLVLDFAAFTPQLAPSVARLDRLRQKGRYLDANGHVALDVDYPSAELADDSEASQYQRYLLTSRRDQLLSALAPLPLSMLLSDEAHDSDLEAALAGMFATVAAALAGLDSLRLWGAYAFPRIPFGQRLGHGGALGGEDLRTLAGQLASSAVPSRRSKWAQDRQVAYTAIGPLLRQVKGTGRALHGCGYATVIAHANTVVGDCARRDVHEDTGLLADGVHLRVDDTWQSGGIWRAERPGVVPPDVDVSDPLGCGWAEATGLRSPRASESQPEPQPVPEPDFEQESEDEGQVLSVTDSQVMWTQTVRLSHQLGSYLPVPSKLATLWEGALDPGPVKLTVHHDGHDLDPDEASQDVRVERDGDTWTVTGVTWPLEFFGGIVLLGTWQRGGRLLRVRSTLLDFPVTVDGFYIAHRYDPAVLTRERPPSTEHDQTWEARILVMVRRAGLLDAQGCALIAQHQLLSRVCPTGQAGELRAVSDALDSLVAGSKLTRTTGGLGPDRLLSVPCPPGGSPVDVIQYIPTVGVGSPTRPPVPAVLRGLITSNGLAFHILREVDVAGHIRRLPQGQQASAQKRAEYREFRARYGLSGPRDLPAGCTFVSPFQRGV